MGENVNRSDLAANEDLLILVDEQDREVGTETKSLAHYNGDLHRAFSVNLYCGNKLLLQQRAENKYHSGGLWTNACCSHPRAGESLEEAVHKRLQLELGVDTEVEELFSFVYQSQYGEHLFEHEFDHVFLGYYNETQPLILHPDEAMDSKWVDVDWLEQDLMHHPEHYTTWFVISAPRIMQAVRERNKTNSSS